MRLSVLDLPLKYLTECHETLVWAIETQTRFGVGAAFEKNERRQHKVMDEDWSISRITKEGKDKAWKQLGTSGGGNHFVEFGELILDNPALGLETGRYLALLSHSGSRGIGEAVASHYSKLARKLRPELPQELQHLAWLDLSSPEGQEYWQAMHLMGKYASANHELIHRDLLRELGVQAMATVENHHNFAWQEIHDGQEVVVHRKGATPANEGVLGVVPGSMGTPGFVVQGKGNELSLNSCSHGAGRLMSRSAAFKKLDPKAMKDFVKEKGIHLISGGLDEAPMAYSI